MLSERESAYLVDFELVAVKIDKNYYGDCEPFSDLTHQHAGLFCSKLLMFSLASGFWTSCTS